MSQDSSEKRFVERMQSFRRERGWSQERLAKEVELATGLVLHPTAFTKLEWALIPDKSDKARGLGLDEALAIATTFGVSMEDMITSGDRLLMDLVHADAVAHQIEDQLTEARREVAELEQQLDQAMTRRGQLSEKLNKRRKTSGQH